ncbi:MAG: prolipoprotein diacylglyceryl transferase [bacterium]|nr:prolipoprotein diacylglyceryl transferase [bacterium]
MTNVVGYWVHTWDPVALRVGPLAVRGYGLMYLIGFGIGYGLLWWRQRAGLLKLPSVEALEDLVFYGFCGVLIGGRLGHCVFYELGHYLRAPWEIVMIWRGGMSSHGGFVGVMVALWLFGRRWQVSFLHLLDNVVVAAGPGLFFGRIGNFINAELWGRVTNVPWAVIFPCVDGQPRHPVQIYQAIAEGVVSFAILVMVGRKRRAEGMLSGLFAVIYGVGRLVTEEFRESTEALAGPWGLGVTQGQFLTLFVLAIGIGLLLRCVWVGRERS